MANAEPTMSGLSICRNGLRVVDSMSMPSARASTRARSRAETMS